MGVVVGDHVATATPASASTGATTSSATAATGVVVFVWNLEGTNVNTAIGDTLHRIQIGGQSVTSIITGIHRIGMLQETEVVALVTEHLHQIVDDVAGGYRRKVDIRGIRRVQYDYIVTQRQGRSGILKDNSPLHIHHQLKSTQIDHLVHYTSGVRQVILP